MTVGVLVGLGAAEAPQSASSRESVELFKGAVTLKRSADWTLIQHSRTYQLLNTTSQQLGKRSPAELDLLPKINIYQESMGDHAAVLARLTEIAAESSTPPQFSTIAGWPALQRSQLIPKPQSGEGSEHEPAGELVQLRHITIAIAAGNLLLRLDGFAQPSASTLITQEIQQIAQSLQFRVAGDQSRVNQEVQQLRQTPPPRTVAPLVHNLLDRLGQAAPATMDLTSSTSSSTGAAFVNLQIGTEPEVVASTNGKNIVVAQQCNFKTSNDGGQTFAFGGLMPNCGGGDSSLGFGRSGNFYEATIGPDNTCAAKTGICATAINRSTNNGQTFTFVTNAFTCATIACGFGGVPDQEHLAADRFNVATGGDQVYVAIRLGFGYDLACSTDSGGTWPTTVIGVNSGSTDFPRLTVGQDGSLYVVTQNGANVELDKYNSCVNGLTLQFHRTIATGISYVTCPVAGLDRCNNGNNLSSIMVAVDDTKANHVYVTYAVNTSSGVNENVIVQDSTDGGNTWTRPAVQINNSITARRYMPWVCSVGGAAFVSWYDRRASTPCPAPPCAANNDFADYFAASASLDGNGNLAPAAEFQISAPATSDPECAGGAAPGSAQSWSCGARATNDASSCSVQPQLAGRCLTGTRQTCDGLPGNPGSGTACDLATGLPACTVAGESCRPGFGNPKYGDYNGNACAAGRVYTVWGSGTSQPGATAANGINLFFAEKLVCCVPQIQGPGSLSLTTCSGSSTTTTANICNTGKADLQINSITSSNSQFTPIQPSSGFPVTISPDFCFPFQVNFSPTGTGTTNASLTVASNDTVNPSVTIPVTGASPAPKLQLTGSGAFGNVCAGAGAQQTISMCNVGACNLDVTAISSSCADFTLVNPPTLPLAISPDSCVNLTDAFTPTMLGSKSCTLTVTSDSGGVAGTMTMLAESGNTPSPMINIPPDLAFPPTVIQSVGSCKTPEPFPISNIGTCNLNIDNVALSGTNATDYGFSGLPSLPSPLEPGHTLGDGNMNTVFGPLGLGRNRDGLLTVTYESNPITHATTNVTRHVCGEGVKTGARLLVTAGGVPVASVSKIQLVSLTTGKTVDVVEDAPLHSVTPAIAACSPFKFHREWGTVSHPIQLLTGFYRLTVTVEISGKTLSKTVSFNVNTCDFNPNIVVNF